MTDFAEGLIDFGDEKAVTAFLGPYVTQGKITQEELNVVKQASVILLNLGIQVGFQKVTAGQPPSAAPS